MKVAFLVPDNRDEFKQFAEPQPRFGSAPTALLEGFAEIPECEIHVICCLHQPMTAPANLAPNIQYHSLLVSKWGWRLLYIGCIWRIRRKLRALRPDLVHGQGTERYCGLAAAFSGFPNLITVHGNMRAVARSLRAKFLSWNWLTARLEAVALWKTDGVICLTNYTKAQVGKLSPRTWIVPNAVDGAFFKVARQPDPNPTLLCVADFTVYKNQVRLIQALDEVARRHPITLLLAGKTAPGNSYGVEVLRLCEERSWCQHLGLLDPDELRKLLSRAAALLLPSLEDNCPMVILEAMAAGVPVAASAIGGIPDLIEHGKTGLLFDPLEEASILGAVLRIMENPEEAAGFGAAGRASALLRFQPEMVARRHCEIYAEP